MKFLIIFLMISGAVLADQYEIPKGFKQATISSKVVIKDMYLKNMKEGDKVRALDDALVVDEDNHVWLNPKAIGFDVKSPAAKVANVEVSKNRLGYFVHIPFRYKEVNGYSVPFHSQWRAVSKAPIGYIPVLSARVIDPVYPEASSFAKRTLQLRQPYEPSFKRVPVPPNPYDMEKSNDVLQPFVKPNTEPESNPAAPLPPLESEPKPVPKTRSTPNPSVARKGHSGTIRLSSSSVTYSKLKRPER